MGRRWNMPTDSKAVHRNTEIGSLSIQASVFNGSTRVFAPRYRQAHGKAFTHPSPEGQRAADVAYADVVRAFEQFLETLDGRPFVLGSHSQGSVHAGRLLEERILHSDEAGQLVAAYLIGGPLRYGEMQAPVCEEPADTGCIVAWNTRGPAYEPTRLEFDARRADTMVDRIYVNPLTGRRDGTHAPANANVGAVFWDTNSPHAKTEFADAQCVDGALVVTTIGNLERNFASRLLLQMMGPDNFHPVEYQLHYLDLRADVARRVAAWAPPRATAD